MSLAYLLLPGPAEEAVPRAGFRRARVTCAAALPLD
jgi:hypothetical protein